MVHIRLLFACKYYKEGFCPADTHFYKNYFYGPSTMWIFMPVKNSFKNRPHMTFDDASSPADQELSLVQDYEGTVEYATKYTKLPVSKSCYLFLLVSV